MRSLLTAALGALLLVSQLLISGSPAAHADAVVDKDKRLTLSAEELEGVAVLHDGQGHFVVVSAPTRSQAFMYYGDVKSMHAVHLRATSTDTSSPHKWIIHSPRLPLNLSFLEASQSLESWTFKCDDRARPLSIADDKMRDQILQGRFEPAKWRRHAYLLSRDSRGIYYYVDDVVGDEQDLHLYVGRPGKMRKQELLDTVSDSEGDILFTRGGKLRIDGRLGASNRKPTWIVGKKRTELLYLAERADTLLVYNVLGVYAGVDLGNPCEDF